MGAHADAGVFFSSQESVSEGDMAVDAEGGSSAKSGVADMSLPAPEPMDTTEDVPTSQVSDQVYLFFLVPACTSLRIRF